MGVDTHLYLLNERRYLGEIVPVLDKLIKGGPAETVRASFKQALDTLVDARTRRQFPWTPVNGHSGDLQRGIGALDGSLPDSYNGDRDLRLENGNVIARDLRLIREYCLRDRVCNIIVEGLCVPWDLPFAPVHNVTWCLGHSLYTHSKKFEDVLCGEIYSRSSNAPYDIALGDELVDQDLVQELSAEIDRIMPAESSLWEVEAFRNLALLLRHAAQNDGFRIMACYF